MRPDSERSPMRWQMYYKAKPYMNPEDEDVAVALRGEDKVKLEG